MDSTTKPPTTISNSVTIRPRKPSDIPELLESLASVYFTTGYPVDGPSAFPSKISPPTNLRSTVALYGGQLAGHVQLEDSTGLHPTVAAALSSQAPLSSYAVLTAFFLDPAMQGKRIGAELMDYVMTWKRTEGKRLVLVVLEKDAKARKLYEGMGWERSVEFVYLTDEGGGA